MAKQGLKETTVALVLLQDASVLAAQVGRFLCLQGNLAFELTDVFYELLVGLHKTVSRTKTYPFFLSGRHEQKPCF